MKYKVIVAESFNKPAKKLAKRYPSFPKDLLGLIDELEKDPLIGVSLGGSLRKIRLAIKSKAKGKRGGARVISYVYLSGNSVHLLTVYDKAGVDTVSDEQLQELVSEVLQSLENDL